jgi:hypothetical protein
MKKLFQKFNYPEASIRTVKKQNCEIRKIKNSYQLFCNDVRWMIYNYETHLEGFFQLFPHYLLSYGKVITTGLGFGIRERWLSNKINVDKILVIEKNQDVIDIFLDLNPNLSKKITIINEDANDYIGECDVLLMDHYEGCNYLNFVHQSKSIQKNIKCNTSWFWPLEEIITINSFENNIDFYKTYQFYRNKIKTLPNLTRKQLIHFLYFYYNFNKEIKTTKFLETENAYF